MTLYGGIDLHSNNALICVISECDQLISEKRLPTDLPCIQAHLQPFNGDLAGLVAESTYSRIGAALN